MLARETGTPQYIWLKHVCSLPSPAAFVVLASSVGAAAKSDVHTARAPETLKLGVEFVSAFFLARGVLACWVLLKAILCISPK